MNKLLISTLIIAAISLGNAGSTLYLPALPFMATALHTSKVSIQLTLSYFLLGFALSQLLYGPLSDAFGRKINLLAGLSIFCVGSIICMLSPNITVLIIGRVIQGLGIGACNAVGYALMRDIYEGHELTKWLSYMSIFVGMTPLVAPLIGGYIVEYIDWRACFALLTLIGLGLFSFKYFYLPETLLKKTPNAHYPAVMLKNYLFLLKNSACLSSILMASFAFAGILTMGSMLPFLVIEKLGFSPATYGWMAGIPALGYLSGSFLTGKFGRYFKFTHVIRSALILQVITMTTALILARETFTIYSLLSPLFLFLFGIGLIVPTASAAAMNPFPQLAGSTAALLCALMFGIASLSISIGAELNPASPLSLFSVLLATSFLIFLTLLRKHD